MGCACAFSFQIVAESGPDFVLKLLVYGVLFARLLRSVITCFCYACTSRLRLAMQTRSSTGATNSLHRLAGITGLWSAGCAPGPTFVPTCEDCGDSCLPPCHTAGNHAPPPPAGSLSSSRLGEDCNTLRDLSPSPQFFALRGHLFGPEPRSL